MKKFYDPPSFFMAPPPYSEENDSPLVWNQHNSPVEAAGCCSTRSDGWFHVDFTKSPE